MFNNIAQYQQRENNYIVLASRQRAQIHPSSSLSGYNLNLNGMSSNGNGIISMTAKMKIDHNQRPNYVIFNEIVQTTNTYLRIVTRINPEWLEEVVPECDFLNRLNSY